MDYINTNSIKLVRNTKLPLIHLRVPNYPPKEWQEIVLNYKIHHSINETSKANTLLLSSLIHPFCTCEYSWQRGEEE